MGEPVTGAIRVSSKEMYPVVAAAVSSASRNVRPAPTRRVYRLAMLAVLTLFAASLAVFAMRPGDNGALAIIVPPSAGEAGVMRVVGAADAVLVRQSRYPWLAIVHPRTTRDASTFRAALTDAGAWILLHPALLAGCFDQPFSSDDLRLMS